MTTRRLTAGVTVLEFLVMVAVLSLLVTLAVPGMQDTIEKYRADAQANAFVSALAYARSTALSRRSQVVVCTANGNSCGSGASAYMWENGWVIRDTYSDEVLKLFDTLASDFTLRMTGNGSQVMFLQDGAADDLYVFTLHDPGCSTNDRVIRLSPTGRINVSESTCS